MAATMLCTHRREPYSTFERGGLLIKSNFKLSILDLLIRKEKAPRRLIVRWGYINILKSWVDVTEGDNLCNFSPVCTCTHSRLIEYAHSAPTNTLVQLNRRLWLSCYSDYGGIEAWLGGILLQQTEILQIPIVLAFLRT